MKKFKAYFWKNVYKDYKFIDGFVTNEKDFIWVYIYKDDNEMWSESHKLLSNDFSVSYEEGFYGKCFTYTYVKENEVTGNISEYDNCLGYIFLNVDSFYSGTIAHECGHAVISYFNRRIKNCNDLFIDNINNRKDIIDAPLQETFCYMLGSLVNQIVDYYYKNINKRFKNK